MFVFRVVKFDNFGSFRGESCQIAVCFVPQFLLLVLRSTDLNDLAPIVVVLLHEVLPDERHFQSAFHLSQAAAIRTDSGTFHNDSAQNLSLLIKTNYRSTH